MKLNITVIGAGIGGLASAIRLAVRGHEVTVFEQASVPGGKLGQLNWDQYRWETTPSLFKLPELVEELFLLADEEMKVSLRYKHLDTITKYFYEDGVVLNAYSDPEEFISELASKTGENAIRIQRFLNKVRAMYGITRHLFITGVTSSYRTIFSLKFLRLIIQIYRLELFTSMHGANKRRFKSKHLVQLFDSYATQTGSNPFQAPKTLNFLSHVKHNLGTYYPEKGMQVLVDELYALALRLGVNFEFSSKVERIIHRNKIIKAVRVNDQERKADIVISDIDIYYLYKDLLSDIEFPTKYFQPERSTSAIIFYWAMDKDFPELELHNVLFSADDKDEFKHLFNTRSVTEDPTITIYISSKIVKNAAPGGGENWLVMINAPVNTGQDWEMIINNVRTNLISKINRVLGTQVEKHILHETVKDPRSIEDETSSYQGSLYGNSSNRSIAAFKRHPNHRNDFHGLYFVGGSVHPGGSIPHCIASSRIVEHQIINHYY